MAKKITKNTLSNTSFLDPGVFFLDNSKHRLIKRNLTSTMQNLIDKDYKGDATDHDGLKAYQRTKKRKSTREGFPKIYYNKTDHEGKYGYYDAPSKINGDRIQDYNEFKDTIENIPQTPLQLDNPETFNLPNTLNERYANGGMLYNPNLEQYGFGDWLQSNAGAIGSTVGAGLGIGAGALLTAGTFGAAAPLMGTLGSLGASMGGQVGGAMQENYEQGESTDMQSQQMLAQQQQQQYQNKVMSAQQGLQNNQLQQNQFAGTNNFAKYGGVMYNPTSNLNYGDGANNSHQYVGNSHAQGGIKVDAQGNPIAVTGNQPIGEVENGESSYTDPKTKEVYIFSKQFTL